MGKKTAREEELEAVLEDLLLVGHIPLPSEEYDPKAHRAWIKAFEGYVAARRAGWLALGRCPVCNSAIKNHRMKKPCAE